MEVELFDDVKIVHISDEEQLAEIEFDEAQEAFCEASCRLHDTAARCDGEGDRS